MKMKWRLLVALFAIVMGMTLWRVTMNTHLDEPSPVLERVTPSTRMDTGEQQSPDVAQQLDDALQHNELVHKQRVRAKAQRPHRHGDSPLFSRLRLQAGSAPTPGHPTLPRYVPLMERVSETDLTPVSGPRSDLCDQRTIVVIAVCSDVLHRNRRETIRETWGSQLRHDPGLGVRLLFVVGQPKKEHEFLNDNILNESRIHGDLLILPLTDTSQNLTLKTVAVLRWTALNCEHTKFFMKTDDDVYVHVAALLALLVELLHSSLTRRLLLGRAIDGARPADQPRAAKWYTPTQLYLERTYPRYLSGSGYLVSADQVSALYKVAMETPPFWLEDVHVAGILPIITQAMLVHSDLFRYSKHTGSGICDYRRLVLAHGLTTTDMHAIWREMLAPTVNCDSVIR